MERKSVGEFFAHRFGGNQVLSFNAFSE